MRIVESVAAGAEPDRLISRNHRLPGRKALLTRPQSSRPSGEV